MAQVRISKKFSHNSLIFLFFYYLCKKFPHSIVTVRFLMLM